MKKILLTSQLLILFLSGITQGTIQLSGHLPTVKTAEAMDVERYTSYPVSYSTGQADISIPLYEIKVGNVSLPITLSYRSSGFRPNDADGRIAAGWTLNAEPSISKEVRGLDDASENGFWHFNTVSFKSMYGENLYKKRVADGLIDAMPDIYYYKLANKGGSFVPTSYPGTLKQFAPQPYDDTKITGDVGEVEIVDDGGIQYKFGGAGYRETYMVSGLPVRLLCKEITSKMTKAKIEFVYNSAGLDNLDYKSHQFKDAIVIDAETAPHPGGGPDNHPRLTTVLDDVQYQYRINSTGSYYDAYGGDEYMVYVGNSNSTEEVLVQPLREIRFDNGTVLFEGDSHSTIRIWVKDKSGRIIKEVRMHCSPYRPYGTADMQHRKLDSVIIAAPGGEIQRYAFDYYSPEDVPDLDSRSIDYWGFYNGASTSTSVSLVPSFTTTVNVSGTNVTYQHIGANRTPNAHAARTGVLSRITHPSGAETTFQYEGNRTGLQYWAGYDGPEGVTFPNGFWTFFDTTIAPQLHYDIPVGGLRVRQIAEDDPVTDQKLYRDFTYGSMTEYWDDLVIDGWGAVKNLINSNTFLVTQNHTRKIYGSVSNTEVNYNIKTWYSNPVGDITFNGGTPILYNRIRERKWGNGTPSMVTEYNYTAPRINTKGAGSILDDHCVYLDYTCLTQNPRIVINDWRDVTKPFGFRHFSDEVYGQLYKKIDYRYGTNGFEPLRKEEFTNSLIRRTQDIPMYSDYVYRTKTYTDQTSTVPEADIANLESFSTLFPLQHEDGYLTHNILTNHRVVDYQPNGDSLVVTKDYTYTNDNTFSGNSARPKVRRITTHLSGGKQEQEYFTYSDGHYSLTHYPETLYPTSGPSTPPGGVLTEYKKIQGTDTVYKRQVVDWINNLYNVSSIKTKMPLGVSFDGELAVSHNTYGNITETMGRDGVVTAYIWSYNNQCLVAKIENAGYSQVALALSTATGLSMEDINSISDLGTYTGILAQIEGLRTSFPDAMVSTFQYKPLIGMISSTDASGRSMYYEYDASNRLKRSYYKENGVEETVKAYQYNLFQ